MIHHHDSYILFQKKTCVQRSLSTEDVVIIYFFHERFLNLVTKNAGTFALKHY